MRWQNDICMNRANPKWSALSTNAASFCKIPKHCNCIQITARKANSAFFCCCIFHSNFPHDGSPSSRKHIQKSNAKQEVVVLPSFIIYFKNPVEYAVHDALNAKKLALQEYVSTTSSKTVFLSIFIDGIKIKPINGLITPPPPFSWMNSRRRHYPRARITKVTWPKSENAMPAVGCQLQSSVGGMCSLVHHQKVNQ